MKRIALIITVAVLGFAPAGVARAELCEKCKGKMYVASVGKCVDCGGFTSSGAHKLCRKCSAKLSQCEHCRAKLHADDKPLPQKPKDKPILIKPKPGPTPVQPIRIDPDKILQPGTHVSGKWKYVYTIRAKGTNSEGHYGKLFYDGKEVPKPAGINDYYKTPWGLLYWVVSPRWNRHGWMPPGKRTANIGGRLLPSPAKAAPAYLSAIELDDSHKGKTVSAIVGQEIIIRLKGAPVPGHMWDTAKLAGDAIKQVGKMKFIPDARPQPPVFVPDRRHQQPGPVPAPNARPQPVPGRGLVAHTAGGPGKYVFTFRAVKAGKAEVTIKGRPHRQSRPARIFALTVNVKKDPTAERVKKLKANLDKFSMTISYQGTGPTRRTPRWCRHITLSVPPTLVPRTPSWQVRRISKEQAEKIIDRLAKAGFLARAVPRTPVRKMGDRYALAVRLRKPGPRSPMLMDIVENIGWGPQLLKRLENLGLKEVLDGDAAKAFDFLIEPIREKFGKEKEKPAPAKVEKIDTKKSGTYKSGKWEYRYKVKRPGTRQEGYWGRLFYDGKEIMGLGAHNIGLNDYYETPWGKIYWIHLPEMRQGPHGWMPNPSPYSKRKGRLLPSPEKTGTSQIAPVELDDSHNGKTVSAVVGQAIVISLKGNPTTGFEWMVGDTKGDAVGQIGTMKYVSDAPARPAPGGRGRPSMMRVGGGGKFVFTFRAVKAGKSTLTLEYKRGWEKKPPHKTFTLTVNVKKDPASAKPQAG